MTMKHHHPACRFFGTSTIGEKGQVVVPAEVRTAEHMSAQLDGLRAIMRKSL
jgi:hypothetical protein